MQSIMEELCAHTGNFHPLKRTYAPESQYHESAYLRQKNYYNLLELLNDAEKVVFEKYRTAQDELGYLTHLNAFSGGLKFGVLLMTEVFAGKE